MDCTNRLAKTKALISFAVTAKLICVFVFAYAKSRFSHDAAHFRDALEKFTCFATIINEGRPALYACQAQDFISFLTANTEPGDEDTLNFNPYTCFGKLR